MATDLDGGHWTSRAVSIAQRPVGHSSAANGCAGLVEVDHVVRDGDHALEHGLRAAGARSRSEMATREAERADVGRQARDNECVAGRRAGDQGDRRRAARCRRG